jgi:hypothetical protein
MSKLKFKKNVNTELFKGHISYVMLGYEERVGKAQEVFVNLGEQPVIDEDGNETGKKETILNTTAQLELGKKYYTIALEQITDVSIEIIADGDMKGTMIDSLEQLYCFQEGAEIVNEIVNVILGGHRLGKI